MPVQVQTSPNVDTTKEPINAAPAGPAGTASPAGLGRKSSASISQASLPRVTLSLDVSACSSESETKSNTHSHSPAFIDGYDNAVVHTNIHTPAEAQPVRAGRASNVAAIEGIGASSQASKASFRLAAIPDSTKYTTQTDRLHRGALSGGPSEIKALADWANVHEMESEQLRVRVRKQQHDFASLFEMVSAASARALDVISLQTYMLRTVSGHFATPRVMIVRRLRPEDREFYCTASQGLKSVQFKLDFDSPLCRYAFERGSSFALRELTGPASPEIETLRELGIETAVPLLQEVDRSGAVLEGFVFLGQKLTRKGYSKNDAEFLDVLSKMFAICLRNENLYRRSIIDTLTGVSSRGHFDAQLSQELERAANIEGKSLCLMMLDVDHFKKFNDTYGHQTGDLVLKSLAKVLIQQVRNVDLVARYGGEEFAIICVEIDRAVVKEVAERLLNAVRDMEISAPDGSKLHITASFGIACFPEDANNMTSLIQMADTALYKSKDAGRNRVTMADATARTLPPPPCSNRGENPDPLAPEEHRPAPPSSVPVSLELLRSKQAQAAKNPASTGEADRRGNK